MHNRSAAGRASPSDEVADLEALTLSALYRCRELSPVEVAKALLDRIGSLNPYVNAVVHVDRAYTLAMATAAERRYSAGAPLSLLDGVPLTIKDLSAVIGMPLRRGSLAFGPNEISTSDAPCVARLREAGSVFLGKTATPDAGCKVVTRSAVHGVTVNPYDLTKTPGGSSGGAAAAIALGFGPLAVGSDGAGSLRIPASFTNIFAIKPSFGRVSVFPHGTDMPMSVVGPMAKTVSDAAAMLEVMAGLDPRDPYAWPVPFTIPPDLASPNLADLRIAISGRLGCHSPLVDGEVDALVSEARPLLEDAGAHVDEADPIWPVDPREPFDVFWETAYADTANGFDEERQQLLDPLIRSAANLGRRRSMTDIFGAMSKRIALAEASKIFFNSFDLLVGPVMPIPPFAADRDVPAGFADGDWSWCPYTYLWNMTGQPAASVPIGFTIGGLPVGLQIIGPVGGEANILRAAAAIQHRRPLYRRRPAIA